MLSLELLFLFSSFYQLAHLRYSWLELFHRISVCLNCGCRFELGSVMSGEPEEEPPIGASGFVLEGTPINSSRAIPVFRIYYPGEHQPGSQTSELYPSSEPLVLGSAGIDPVDDGRETTLLVAVCGATGQLELLDWGAVRRDHTLIAEIPSFGDTRYYVVWLSGELEDPTELSGLHFGRDDTAYRGILAHNRYQFRSLRFRRVSDLSAGHFIFLSEAEGHGVPGRFSTRIFGWQ